MHSEGEDRNALSFFEFVLEFVPNLQKYLQKRNLDVPNCGKFMIIDRITAGMYVNYYYVNYYTRKANSYLSSAIITKSNVF